MTLNTSTGGIESSFRASSHAFTRGESKCTGGTIVGGVGTAAAL